jgi:threonine dehydratase
MDPTPADVRIAALVIERLVHHTPVLRSRRIDAWAGRNVWMKAEHLQRSGAFKFRGATNAVWSLSEAEARRGVATHSSGNHAGALALAAYDRGIRCTVVMPAGAVAPKRAAAKSYRANIVECEPTLEARERSLAAVVADTGAVEVHPYDHARVIAGAGTSALELLEEVPDLDAIVVPVGGGGLASGTSIAVKEVGARARVVGAEPAGADDAARSLAAGHLLPQDRPETIADGLRTSLSPRTFRMLSAHLDSIVTVPDDETVAAMAMVWSATKQVIEPSAAVAVAALRHLDSAEKVGVILSGGNVDLRNLPW